MKRKAFSILFALVLVLSFSLIPAAPVMATGTTTTLSIPENVYRPVTFDATSTTTNSGTPYTNVRFNITVSGPEAFTEAREDIFTITQVVPGGVQGINETFVLVGGDFVGYWGPVDGFPLPASYSVTSTFTIQMTDGSTAPVGGYEVTVELVDLTPEPDITLATATAGFSLSADTLYVGAGQQFTTIQAAIDAASPGDTIIVAAGTYNENVVVNKSVTLQSAEKHKAKIDGDTTGDGVPDGSCMTLSANGVTIDGFDIRNGYNGIIGETDNSIISNNNIHGHLNYVGSNGVGILLWGDNDNNQILDNKIEQNDRQGIFIGYGGASKISNGNMISGNDIKKNGLYTQPNGPDASAYGIQLWNADGNTIENNKIRDHDDWFPYGGTTFDWAQGIYLCAAFNNIVKGNDLHKNNFGVGAYSSGRTPVGSNQIHYNNIRGNTGYGVMNSYDTITLDATCNWWGHYSGPGGVGLGTGDAVSGNVVYDPWLALPVGSEFEIEKAKLEFKKKVDDDKVHVKGHLDTICYSGVAISDDDVTVTVVSDETILSWTIPGGTMEEKGKEGEKWEYKRPKHGDGDIKRMTIDWKKGKFDVQIDKADISGLTDPDNVITIDITIGGHDFGSGTITMTVKKDKWEYKAPK